jgi:hypothetical protein
MRLDGLIRFLTPRLESVVSHQPGIVSGRLLPHEELALALYRFTESSGKSQWRPTSLGDLHNLTRADHGLVVDELKRLHSEGFLGLRKWSDAAGDFVPYFSEGVSVDAEFFYRATFELRVLPRGRPWFESIERRDSVQNVGSIGKTDPGEETNPAWSSTPILPSIASSAPPRAFISYSWDNVPHKEWVRGVARRLREESGVNVTLDRWHLQPGDQLPQFMESAVRDNDYVLIVCTAGYRSRSDQRKGGVGYEGDVMTGEVYASANHRKFIPLLRDGGWREAAPSWLSGKFYLDFRGDPYSEQSYDTLIKTLHGVDAGPPIGPRPNFSSTTAAKNPAPKKPTPTKRPRKKPTTATETAVLIKSARRCPLCFHLHGDLTPKLGQIAHLDGDRTNGAEDNLAWLCMPHHSEYDSTTSQHKNYTVAEIKEMRRRLYEAIGNQQHVGTPKGGEADRETLASLLQVNADAAKKSADVLMLGDRAWVLKDKIQDPYLPTDEQLIVEQRVPHCIVFFKNAGKTPAKITACRFELELSDNPNVPPHSAAYESPEVSTPDILPPGGSAHIEARMNSVQRMTQECDSVKKGLRSLWLCGIVKYVDVFGRGQDSEHETRICYVWETRMNASPFWSMRGDATYNNST